VALYGGFPTGGGNWEDRDPNDPNNETILSGDLNGDDVGFTNNDENSYTVVTGSGTNATAVLDGFAITASNANNYLHYPEPNGYGGGMYNDTGSPTVTSCTFSKNMAYYGSGMCNWNNSSPMVTNCTFSENSSVPLMYKGGGMYNELSSPTVTNCTFTGNLTGAGGGICNNDNSNPNVTNCTFSGNEAGVGGGMYNQWGSSPIVSNCTFTGNLAASNSGGMANYSQSSPTVTNCTFSGNTAAADGGGMYNEDNSSPTVVNCTFVGNSSSSSSSFGGGGMYNRFGSNPIVSNCTFTGNSAASNGGGMCNFNNSSPTVTNCTFSGNSAGSYGGGMCNFLFYSNPTVTNCTFTGNTADYGGGMGNLDSYPTVTNCILWGNTAPSGAQIYNEISSPSVNYSDVEGGYGSGVGNINADPLFVDADGPDNIVGTEDDNLRLSPGSPCIDAGDNTAVPADTADLDNDGNTVEPTPWDLDGRDRFADGDCNDTEIVDMGAYEFAKFAWVYIGDFAGGCDVDFVDFSVLGLTWLLEEQEAGYDPNCDISLPADGVIDEKDLKIFTDNWLAGM
jgi:parallel beta-helix repeat protein